MAGDWIKVEHVTPGKPEVIAMATDLGIEEDAVCGKLIRLWIWADQQSIDGNALSVTDLWIERYTNCAGFAKAMRKAGWLNGESGVITFPNFTRHNGKSAKKRINSLERVKRFRNADSVSKALPEKEKRRDKKTKAKEKRKPEYTPEFELFWDAYPSREGTKIGKIDTFAEWELLSLEDRGRAMAALPAYSRRKTNPKDPQRYLSKRIFEELLDLKQQTSIYQDLDARHPEGAGIP